MTSFVATEGKKTVYDVELTGTTEHTVVPAISKKTARTIESILFSSDGTSDTVTLRIKNGSTVLLPLLDGAVLDPANNLESIPNLFQIEGYPRPILEGESITAQCVTGGHLWVSIVMVEQITITPGK